LRSFVSAPDLRLLAGILQRKVPAATMWHWQVNFKRIEENKDWIIVKERPEE
jgi:hypothetical protein